jgi:hypothetical protein
LPPSLGNAWERPVPGRNSEGGDSYRMGGRHKVEGRVPKTMPGETEPVPTICCKPESGRYSRDLHLDLRVHAGIVQEVLQGKLYEI